MTPQPNTVTPFRPALSPHLHVEGKTCPWCEQEIPPEKLEEISGKIALREHEQALAITARLEQKHEADRAEADAIAKASLELERRQSAEREAAARDEAKKIAEAAAAERIAAAEASRQQSEAALQARIEQEQTARQDAEQASAARQAQLEKERQENAMALAAAKAEAEARETAIRTEAQQIAEADMAEKLAASETAHAKSDTALRAQIEQAEATRAATEQKGEALQEQLTALQQANEAELAKVKEDAAAEAIRIRQEATTAAEAALQTKIEEADATRVAAEQKGAALQEQLTALQQANEAELTKVKEEAAARLAEQREVLEKAATDAANAKESKHFEENLKLTNKVEELKRALEKKSNEELGEGAEIDLFEALKAEFPDDNIKRIPKGSPGADIRHIVMMNGKGCGTILYDSKNHKQFRSDHFTKLKADQIADKAEHAILSTYKLPQGMRHIHVQDGVVLASPARVVAIVTLIRQHLTLMHTLRVSSVERETKMAELYAFIISERYAQLLSRIEKQAEDLLDLQTKEIKWHKNNWEKQGGAYKAIQKAKGDLQTDISRILGTAADSEPALEEVHL